jgi:hypothetical protein
MPCQTRAVAANLGGANQSLQSTAFETMKMLVLRPIGGCKADVVKLEAMSITGMKVIFSKDRNGRAWLSDRIDSFCDMSLVAANSRFRPGRT